MKYLFRPLIEAGMTMCVFPILTYGTFGQKPSLSPMTGFVKRQQIFHRFNYPFCYILFAQIIAFDVFADAEKVFVVLQFSVGFALLCDGAVVVVFAFRAVPHIECGVFFGIEIIQPAVVFGQRNRRYVGFVAVPVQADAQAAAVQ